MRNKNRQINFRVTEKEYSYIYDRSQKANMCVSDFILNSVLEKEIVIVDGLPTMINEIRKIGVNLNQLTRLANEGRITTVELYGMKKGINNIWLSLDSLTRKVT